MTPDTTAGRASRRAFLGLAMSAGAAAATGGAAARAATRPKRAAYREAHRIDVHAHYLAPAYVEALHAAGIFAIGGIPIPEWSPELALQFMDAHGIAVQLLSVSDPGVAFAPDADAAALARVCNDYVAGVIKAHPSRFGAFAVLPLHDPVAAAAEASRALGDLRLDGVGLLSSSAGRYLGDPAFEPLLAELDRRRAWVFVHPTAVAAEDKPGYAIPDFIAEYPFDTTRTIISLLFSDAFRRHPRIRWHFGHGGGTLPMLGFRLTTLAANAKQFGALLGLPGGSERLTAKTPEQVLRRCFYDTALIAEPAALRAVATMAGPGRMVFGSDWPFAARAYTAAPDPQPALSAAFTAAERRDIDRRTGRAQFRRLQKVVPKA